MRKWKISERIRLWKDTKIGLRNYTKTHKNRRKSHSGLSTRFVHSSHALTITFHVEIQIETILVLPLQVWQESFYLLVTTPTVATWITEVGQFLWTNRFHLVCLPYAWPRQWIRWWHEATWADWSFRIWNAEILVDSGESGWGWKFPDDAGNSSLLGQVNDSRHFVAETAVRLGWLHSIEEAGIHRDVLARLTAIIIEITVNLRPEWVSIRRGREKEGIRISFDSMFISRCRVFVIGKVRWFRIVEIPWKILIVSRAEIEIRHENCDRQRKNGRNFHFHHFFFSLSRSSNFPHETFFSSRFSSNISR